MSHPAFDAPELPRGPAPERNKQPILEALRTLLPKPAQILEIASGTGQHAAWFAHHEPSWLWQPSDLDPANIDAIRAWAKALQAPNLLMPVALDTHATQWPVEQANVIYCANMVHIAPWSATIALVAGAERVLPLGGLLVLYGPWCVDGRHVSDSNVRFDASLRERNPTWGVRDIQDLKALLPDRQLTLENMLALPANNHLVVIRKTGSHPAERAPGS